MDFERRLNLPANETVDLSIGDSIRLGNQLLTVVDIDGDEVCFKIDSAEVSITSGHESNLRPATPR